MISFGPVPSRRLGKSLGINNIPSRKVCSYACTYCQVGRTYKHTSKREQFYSPEVLFFEVQKHISALKEEDKPDYLTFVANGEPTLDINIGQSIQKLKELGIPIAVITNATLLTDEKVRDELCLASWVSVKVDAGNASTWKTINRPCTGLLFEEYLDGISKFATQFNGTLATETMLVSGVNDSTEALKQIASIVEKVNPSAAYLSIPTRPPTAQSVHAPSELAVNEGFQIFKDRNINVELLLGFEGTNYGHTGNIFEDIVNISTVHPIREDAMLEFIKKSGADPSILNDLLQSDYIKKVQYKSDTYYIRYFHL